MFEVRVVVKLPPQHRGSLGIYIKNTMKQMAVCKLNVEQIGRSYAGNSQLQRWQIHRLNLFKCTKVNICDVIDVTVCPTGTGQPRGYAEQYPDTELNYARRRFKFGTKREHYVNLTLTSWRNLPSTRHFPFPSRDR